MKHTSRKFAKLTSAAFVAAALATGALAQEVTLTLQHFLPAQANVPRDVLGKWSADVQEASGGRIAVDIYPAMQLGGTPPELMDQTAEGVIDIAWTVVGYTPGRFPRTEVFELPFMITDAGPASRAYWRMYEKHMQDTEFDGLKILGTWVHGPGVIHSDEPVTMPGDLAGMKIRGGSRTINNLLTELGATPVGMPVPAVPEGLSKGVLDGTTIPWEVTTALKVPELVSNHTEFGTEALYTLTFVLVMNEDKYNSLPDDLKAVIDGASGEEFSVFAGTTQQAADGPARQIAVDRGNNIVQLDETQIAAWKAAAEPIYEAWIADMQERGIDGAALIEEARALIEEFSN